MYPDTNLWGSISHFFHLILVFHELCIKFTNLFLYRLPSTVHLSNRKKFTERCKGICSHLLWSVVFHDVPRLTLEMASVRFGGGSFGFPRPNNLFILEQLNDFFYFLEGKSFYFRNCFRSSLTKFARLFIRSRDLRNIDFQRKWRQVLDFGRDETADLTILHNRLHDSGKLYW